MMQPKHVREISIIAVYHVCSFILKKIFFSGYYNVSGICQLLKNLMSYGLFSNVKGMFTFAFNFTFVNLYYFS